MGKMSFTPQQQRVIDSRDCNLLVAAAAGSGKTAVLTARIMALISDPDQKTDIDHLLIVTFTKAAAAEMRERIGQEIDSWLEEHPSDLNMQRQQTLLHNAQITTIDSFCLYIIRNNFADIGLDPGFRSMDDGESSLMKADIMDEILEENFALVSENKADDFRYLMECYTDQGKEKELVKYLLGIYNMAMSHPFPDEWLENCRKDYEVENFEQLAGSSWWKEGMRLSRLYLQEAFEIAGEGVRMCMEEGGPMAYLPTLQAQLHYAESLLETEDYGTRWRILQKMDIPSFKAIKAKEQVDEVLKTSVTECRNRVKKIFEKVRDRYYVYTPARLLESQRSLARNAGEIVRLVSEFKRRFTGRKRQQNLLDFSDMEHLALQILLTKREDGEIEVTDTARGYQDYYAQVMVDEYQDSNYVQEYILKSVSNGSNYFMVGDVKQSIYRFRLAKPEIFLHKYERSSDSGKDVRIDLNKNFRSREEVLEGINAVFEQIMTPEVAGMAYDEKARLYPGAVYPPNETNPEAVKLLLVDPENIQQEACEESQEEADSFTGQEAEGRVIAGEIRRMFEEHMLVTDKKTGCLRPLCCRDIVILVRATGELSEEIRKALEAVGIPAYLSAKTGYFAAMEIRCILNYLMVIDNPRQDIPLYGCLTSFFGGLTQEEAALLYVDAGKQEEKAEKKLLYDRILQYLSQDKKDGLTRKLDAFVRQLTAYRERACYTTIHDLLRMIYDDTGYLAYMTAYPGGARRQANLYMLLEKASAFEQTSYHGLFHFVRYIRQLKEQEVDYGEAGMLDENADVVRIMTIHKSKGLEFPVCVLAGMGKRMNKRDAQETILTESGMGIGLDDIRPETRRKMPGAKKLLMAEKISLDSLAEEIRILYVAMTRAKEKLLMTGVCKGAEEYLSKLPGKVSAGSLLNAKSYLELVCMGYAAAGRLGQYVQTMTIGELLAEETGHTWKGAYLETLLQQGSTADSELYRKLCEKMQFTYAYPSLKGLYTKTTVSELKKEAYEDEQAKPMFEEEEVKPYIPTFAREGEEQSYGTRRGTAYHRVMELFPFEQLTEDMPKIQCRTFVEKVIGQITEEGYISPEDAALVAPDKCAHFLGTRLAGQMAAAAREGRLYKEQPFFLGMQANRIQENFPESEYILVQGVVDAYYEEADGIVIMDYKTDRVMQEEILVQRYHRQLDIYAEALERITGRKVIHKMIYSFALGREIECV